MTHPARQKRGEGCSGNPSSPGIDLLPSPIAWVHARVLQDCCPAASRACLASLQEAYSAGVKHYEREEYGPAIEQLERALEEYYTADEECRVLCEGPQRFAEHEFLDYQADLYEAVAGEAWVLSSSGQQTLPLPAETVTPGHPTCAGAQSNSLLPSSLLGGRDGACKGDNLYG